MLCCQGFLDPGTDIRPIVPALEKIWADSLGRSLSDFNFRSVTSKFNELVFEYPIRIPERYALVIRCGHLCTWQAAGFAGPKISTRYLEIVLV
jgi:predicted unusual protein kinase regulating ubiquinone biosynthesis (AarF/ABC1/UbiB family)